MQAGLCPRHFCSIPSLVAPVLAAVALVAAGCSGDPAETTGSGGAASSGPGGAGGAGGEALDLPWNAHKIPPKDTDPAIDDALDAHYAGFDAAAASNGKLFVHLPGTLGTPAQSSLILTAAARAGYHVVGLMYPNGVSVSDLCGADLDCYEPVRLEIIDGVDRTDKIAITAANSIQNRLIKLLEHANKTFPDEGWSAFLKDGEPVYASIALSGLSQGGGHAALIAKSRALARVVLFSAVTDGSNGMPASWLKQPASTVNSLHYGLAHADDPAIDQILANWGTLGLSFFGIPVDDAIGAPYANSHQLTTARPPASGSAGAHGSTAGDADTPLTPEGEPALAEAWAYLIGK